MLGISRCLVFHLKGDGRDLFRRIGQAGRIVFGVLRKIGQVDADGWPRAQSLSRELLQSPSV